MPTMLQRFAPIRIMAATLALTIATGSLAVAPPAWADPPGGHKEKGRGHGPDRGGPRPGPGGGDVNVTVNFNFNDNDRMIVRDYYGAPPPRGHCPPGLAKKGNGCMPPGHAKKWMIGRPLPPDVIYYAVPQPVIVHLQPPPPGYRYVRVAGDILMIAAGTGMVMAAIEDLGRM